MDVRKARLDARSTQSLRADQKLTECALSSTTWDNGL